MQRLRFYLVRQLWRHGLALLLTGAVPLLIVLYWLRIFGLPEVAKAYLLEQVVARHLLAYPLEVKRLRLDASGKILAENVTLFRDDSREQILLQIDEIHVGLSPWNWFRGQGLINSAAIMDAHARIPVAPEEAISLREVNADIRLRGHDIRIENARAQFHHLELHVRGTLHNDGFPLSKAPPAHQLSAQADFWRTLQNLLEGFKAPSPIVLEVEFEAKSSSLAHGQMNFGLEARQVTWRTVPLEEISLHGNLRDGVAALEDFRIGMARGDLTAQGAWDILAYHADLQFISTLDLPLLAPAFPGPTGEILRRLDFPAVLPSLSGHLVCDLEQGFKFDLQADLDGENFTFNGVHCQELTVPLAYDGKRLLIPGLKWITTRGNVDLELFYDGTKPIPELNARYDSTLDPTIFTGVFGPGFDNFLGSCSFARGAPQIQGTAHGSSLRFAEAVFAGKVSAKNFIYKKAVFTQANADFTFTQNTLNMPNLLVSRPEGNASGGLIYDFQDRWVLLHHFTVQMDVPVISPVLGEKFTQYTSPYHFSAPPLVQAEGKVDFQSDKKDLATDLTVQLQGNSVMAWTLFGIPFHFDHPQGTMLFKDRSLLIQMDRSGFYQGNFTAKIKLDLRINPSAYDLDLNLDQVDFQSFMSQVFHYDKSTGQMLLQGHFSGSIGQMESLTGTGLMHVTDGDITQIPLLGSLTPLIPGFSAADSAYAHFSLAKGFVRTDDLAISSETLALIGNGSYDFIHDAVNLDMRVNAKSIFGLLLYPVSKIFEFHGTGPLKDVKWASKNF